MKHPTPRFVHEISRFFHVIFRRVPPEARSVKKANSCYETRQQFSLI
jgi:hypothetical protein